jgi:hypothetical protein
LGLRDDRWRWGRGSVDLLLLLLLYGFLEATHQLLETLNFLVLGLDTQQELFQVLRRFLTV